MDRPPGHSLHLSVSVREPLWHVGAGWAAIGGAIACGVLSGDTRLALSPPFGGLLTLALVWLLADPLLGTVWDLVAGRTGVRAQRHTLDGEAVQPLHWLPFTQPRSPAWWLAERLSRWRARWFARSDQPETQPGIMLPAALALAVVLAVVLGYGVVLLVALSVLLAWLAARLAARDDTGASANSRIGPSAVRAFGIFGVPWLIGCVAGGDLDWPAVLLGLCLTIAYAGVLLTPLRFRLVGVGQLAVLSLLMGLRQPLAAALIAVGLVGQWGLASAAAGRASDRLRRAIHPFILAGLLIGALAIGV